MITIEVSSEKSGAILYPDVRLAERIWSRFKGLQLQPSISDDEGLILRPCSSVHTFFMRFSIDLAHLDRHGKVLAVTNDLKPWKIGPLIKGTRQILEAKAGTMTALGIKSGDRLLFTVKAD